jgi:hypothetical protein
MEEPVHVKNIKVELINQPGFEPPEVPAQGRVINAVAGQVGRLRVV